MDITQLHIIIGWSGMLAGAFSGALLGLYFYKQDWAGGYGSFRRRMMRLGHIAFFGIGFLNFMFAFSMQVLALPEFYEQIASTGFLLAMLTMPLCCFLSAWHDKFRHLFFIPVSAVTAGILPILAGGFSA